MTCKTLVGRSSPWTVSQRLQRPEYPRCDPGEAIRMGWSGGGRGGGMYVLPNCLCLEGKVLVGNHVLNQAVNVSCCACPCSYHPAWVRKAVSTIQCPNEEVPSVL